MTDLTFEQVTEIITKDVMEQYEHIRQLGPCNMFNTICVTNQAWQLDFDDLAEIYDEHYGLIWQNFGKLMKHYRITQPHQEASDA